jgi:CheY-like chemotaxis protein
MPPDGDQGIPSSPGITLSRRNQEGSMKKLLMAESLKPFMASTLNFLRRAEISVFTAASNDDILKLHITDSASLIMTDLDMPGMSCETLIHTIRRSESMRNVSIILICDDVKEERDRCAKSGANAVVTRPIDPMLLAEKAQRLLEVAPRRAYRVVLNVAMEGRHGNRPFICSSQNISTKGMLIRSAEVFSPGEHIDCSFYLPDGTRLTASGRIVRIVKRPPGSDANHYGIQFTTLTPVAQQAISFFVAREHPGTTPEMHVSSELIA